MTASVTGPMFYVTICLLVVSDRSPARSRGATGPAVNRSRRMPVNGVDRANRSFSHINLSRGNTMSKILSTLLAAVFAAVTITPVAFAADDMKKDEAKKEVKKDEGKKEMKKGEGKKTDGKEQAEAKKTDGKKKAEAKKDEKKDEKK
jgi:pentapeptide MXKDX repeat protein